MLNAGLILLIVFVMCCVRSSLSVIIIPKYCIFLVYVTGIPSITIGLFSSNLGLLFFLS